MSDEADTAAPIAEPQRTDPRGFIVRAITQLLQGALPALAYIISTGGFGLPFILAAVAVGSLVSFAFAWLRWQHHTYTTGPEDIRVEKGIIAHSARSVPYERIQDVSIEQKWLPRLFGLAELRFETGAGGKDELALSYLSLEECERLRTLVRERKLGIAPAVPAPGGEAVTTAVAVPEESEVLFAMDTRRVLTFGLFQFSLVVFAVILGAAQQLDFLLPGNFWDWSSWRWLISSGEHGMDGITHASRMAQVLALLGGIAAVGALGIATGMVRTLLREHGFTLERTSRGLRRRRGLFNRTDVTLPLHRVQAARLGSRLIRQRLGWWGLEFVSLAQDDPKQGHHMVAPFARYDEVLPLLAAVGIAPPSEDLAWHKPSPRPWLYDTLFNGLLFSAIAIGAYLATDSPWPLVAGALAVAATALSNRIAWRRHQHALAGDQLFVRSGTLSRWLDLVPQVKLQSAEIVQSPLGRWRDYATLKLGLAGGRLELRGLPLAEARAIRASILEQVSAVDFSVLPR